MPTIAAVANPIAPPQPSGSRATSDTTPGNETSDRPFAAVLKEKSAAPSESKNESNSADTSNSQQTTESSDSKSDSTSETSIAAQWILNATQAQGPIASANLAKMIDPQTQPESAVAALLARARLPSTTAVDDSAIQSGSKSVDGLTATLASALETPGQLTDANTFEQTMTDIRAAMSRTATATATAAAPTSPDTTSLPAKSAAPLELITLDSASRASQGNAEPVESLLENTGATSAVSTTAATTTTPTARSAEFRITTAVGSDSWEKAVGNSLVVMSGNHQNRAELVLTPPQLGRIEVSLSMRGDDASLTFISASPQVREALENALPRLREVLADAGISLGQTQVGSESPGQTAKDNQNRDNSTGGTIAASDSLLQDLGSRDNSALRRVTLSLVDTYA